MDEERNSFATSSQNEGIKQRLGGRIQKEISKI